MVLTKVIWRYQTVKYMLIIHGKRSYFRINGLQLEINVVTLYTK